MSPRTLFALVLATLAAGCAGSRASAPEPRQSLSLASTAQPGADAPALTSEEALEIDTLVIGLFMEDEPSRILAARKLGAFGPRARSALPYLLDCTVTDTDAAGLACARAAGRVGPAALPALERIAGGSPDRRERVIAALEAMGHSGEPLLLELRGSTTAS